MDEGAPIARHAVSQSDGGRAIAVFTDTSHGDMAPPRQGPPAPDLELRWQAVVDRPLTWLRQVHGGRVVEVGEPGEWAGEEADASVTVHPGAALATFTADCAPVALLSEEGPIGAVHAGWRGLAAGIVPAAVDAVRRLGGRRVHAVLGPCIRPACYEFGAADLDRVAALLGPEVRSTTATGAPALDVAAGVRAALAAAGVHEMHDVGTCTATSDRHWSHRARGDAGRQALMVWRER